MSPSLDTCTRVSVTALGTTPPSPRPSLMNPHIGNVSWEEGGNLSHHNIMTPTPTPTPTQQAQHEKQRVRRHLQYVYDQLMTNTNPNNTSRHHHLQQLARYIEQQSYPLHVDTHDKLNPSDHITCGRAPVFVDGKQRLCAVAHLITYTPHQYLHHPTCSQSSTCQPQHQSCSNPHCAPSSELVSYIAQHWRYGYVMDIVQALFSKGARAPGEDDSPMSHSDMTAHSRYATLFLVWLGSCGLSVSELAVLQPTYAWEDYRSYEERRKNQEQEELPWQQERDPASEEGMEPEPEQEQEQKQEREPETEQQETPAQLESESELTHDIEQQDREIDPVMNDGMELGPEPEPEPATELEPSIEPEHVHDMDSELQPVCTTAYLEPPPHEPTSQHMSQIPPNHSIPWNARSQWIRDVSFHSIMSAVGVLLLLLFTCHGWSRDRRMRHMKHE